MPEEDRHDGHDGGEYERNDGPGIGRSAVYDPPPPRHEEEFGEGLYVVEDRSLRYFEVEGGIGMHRIGLEGPFVG